MCLHTTTSTSSARKVPHAGRAEVKQGKGRTECKGGTQPSKSRGPGASQHLTGRSAPPIFVLSGSQDLPGIWSKGQDKPGSYRPKLSNPDLEQRLRCLDFSSRPPTPPFRVRKRMEPSNQDPTSDTQKQERKMAWRSAERTHTFRNCWVLYTHTEDKNSERSSRRTRGGGEAMGPAQQARILTPQIGNWVS